jgi:cell shape-determining protein MreC
MDISGLMQRLLTFIPIPDLGMEPKTLALLVAILLFLIALLVALIQRRYSKARFDRMLKKEESIVSFLEGINKYLNELEWKCELELDRATSPKEMAKAINGARNKIEWFVDDMTVHLSSFRQYRKKEKAQKKNMKPQEKREPSLRGF